MINSRRDTLFIVGALQLTVPAQPSGRRGLRCPRPRVMVLDAPRPLTRLEAADIDGAGLTDFPDRRHSWRLSRRSAPDSLAQRELPRH